MARLATADRFLISVSTMPGPFTQISGQEVSREISKPRQYAGGPEVPMPNRIQYPDITLMRIYDSDRDGSLYKRVALGELFAGTSITVQEIDVDGNAIPGAAKTYTDCVIKSASAPDGDANSQDSASLTVVFTVGGVAS
jgi:hypothetical protein